MSKKQKPVTQPPVEPIVTTRLTPDFDAGVTQEKIIALPGIMESVTIPFNEQPEVENEVYQLLIQTETAGASNVTIDGEHYKNVSGGHIVNESPFKIYYWASGIIMPYSIPTPGVKTYNARIVHWTGRSYRVSNKFTFNTGTK